MAGPRVSVGEIFAEAQLPVNDNIRRMLVNPGTLELDPDYYTWAAAVATAYSAALGERAMWKNTEALHRATQAAERHAAATEKHAKSLTLATKVLATATIALFLATLALVYVTAFPPRGL